MVYSLNSDQPIKPTLENIFVCQIKKLKHKCTEMSGTEEVSIRCLNIFKKITWRGVSLWYLSTRFLTNIVYIPFFTLKPNKFVVQK